jgi:hypothetical protein
MLNHTRVLALAAAIFVGAGLPAIAQPLQLGGFNVSRGGIESLSSPDEAGLKKAIKKAFPGTTFTLRGSISSTLTSQVNVILIGVATGGNSAITALSRKEQRRLVDFVKAGGTLLIFADNDTFDPNAPAVNASVLSPFGLTATGTLNGNQSVTLSGSPNPVANGPFGTVSSISTSYPGWFSSLGSSSDLGNLDANGQSAIAYLAPGALGTGSGAVSCSLIQACCWTQCARKTRRRRSSTRLH